MMKSKSEILTVDDPSQWRAASLLEPMSVVVIEDFDMLRDYVQAWEDLAEEALELNPFYESWMLIPALRALGTGTDLRVVLVLTVKEGKLCGVFPLEKKQRYKRLPVAAFSLWQHIYCPLCTPLIRASNAQECIDAFLDWLASERDYALMDFNLISGDGPFYELLNDRLTKRGKSSLVCESYTRALFRPMESADKYLQAAISPKHLKDMRRKQRRLSETGRIECDELGPNGDADRWIEEFLKLEVSSWKGKQGGAFACAEANRNYFVLIAKEAFNRGRLMMTAMRLDGQPIAQKFSLIDSRGAFAFKIAYDENYARFSPGTLLEVENICRLHARPDIEWMDSCAAPVHFINRLWDDRRTIKSVLVSTGGRAGSLVVWLIPFMRRLNRALRGFLRKPSTHKEDLQ
ncbi:MAG: hypothetical protein DMF60_03370 [Acidobacteria bacterium]|nr:MAG: hypothetical protein DMF60_03370 [Acidobacteriota bacterium]